jgi:uncharacterized protein YdeI (BOF family)
VSAIMIINNSTLTDYAAVMRTGRLMAGDEYYAVRDENGQIIVKINKQSSNSYIVSDANY